MFCVRCGKEAPLTEALCSDCFLQANAPVRVPAVVRVEICSHCGARKRGPSWGEPLDSVEPAIEAEVREVVDLDPRVGRKWGLRLEGGEHDPTNFEFDVVVEGHLSGLPFEVRHPIVVHLQKSTCTRCGRRTGGYYESILQLRAEGRPIQEDERDQAAAIIDRHLTDMRRSGDLDSFLVRASAVKGGWDFYLGTVHAGRVISRSLANELGAAVGESASLVGRDRMGTDLYRVTFAVKLPPARVGGFVAVGERLYGVNSVSGNKATLLNLEDHRRETHPRAALETVHVLDPSAAVEAVVVSESERELQVLDPESLRTVDLVKPPGFPPGQAQVRVVRWGERLWLLPAAPGPKEPAREAR